MKIFTISYEEKYYHVIRMVFDHYRIKPVLDRYHELDAYKTDKELSEKEKAHWASVTGVYARDDGKIIYYVSDTNSGLVAYRLERLKEAGIVTDYTVEESE